MTVNTRRLEADQRPEPVPRRAALVAAEKIEGGAGRERGGVQSIERAFAILTQIARSQGISLAELSKKVGLHNSTTFHIVRTMVELGIVRQAKDTKKYHLGRFIFSLAANSSGEMELVAAVTPFLEDLARTTGETCHFGFRVGSDVVIAAKVAGSGAFQLVERTGGVRPMSCTALGKVLLADMSEDELEHYLATVAPHVATARSITDPAMLRQEIMRVRDEGMGFDDAEFNSEVRCLAAPVRDFGGRVIGALGLSGPVWRITLPRLRELSGLVRSTADELSRELGHAPQN